MKTLHKVLIGLGIAGAGALVVSKASASSTGHLPPPRPAKEPPPIPIPSGGGSVSVSNGIAKGDDTALVIAPSGLHVRGTPHENGQDKALLSNGTRVRWVEGVMPPTPAASKGWIEVVAPVKGFMSLEWLRSEGKDFGD